MAKDRIVSKTDCKRPRSVYVRYGDFFFNLARGLIEKVNRAIAGSRFRVAPDEVKASRVLISRQTSHCDNHLVVCSEHNSRQSKRIGALRIRVLDDKFGVARYQISGK
ncbi:hypothetical protein BHMPCIPO_02592 [Ensifer sesbaniae]|nr:hypothetical protein [Ensifer sesbaniae]